MLIAAAATGVVGSPSETKDRALLALVLAARSIPTAHPQTDYSASSPVM